MISHRSKGASTPSDMVPVIAAAAAQRLDITKEDPESAPRSLPRSLSLDDRSYERFPLGPALASGVRLNWDPSIPPLVTGPSSMSSTAMAMPLPLSPIRPQSTTWTHNGGPATGIQRDRALSSHLKPDSTQAPPPPPPARSRRFFDIVLAPPVHIPAAKEPGDILTDLHPPSKPASVSSHRAPPAGNAGKKKKKAPKRKVPTPEPESSSSEYESLYDLEDESSDEDEPAPSRGPVKLVEDGSEINQPDIPTSNVRDHCSFTTCNDTRFQFDHEYSRHKRIVILATKPRRSGARSGPMATPVRKSNRIAATRSATPASTDFDSATDVSVSFNGTSRAVSVASTTATAPRSKPRSRSKPKAPRSKSAPRLSTGSNSSRDLSTPQPMSTSIAYPPEDPPPPAPTNVVSLRPGYNAYTPEDKRWFHDFVGWVFRQNVRAGKAEICQDIFQQAPHHRLESWKSYWRDHISEVEMLRNRAREGRPRPEPKRKPAPYPSPSTSASSDGAMTFDGEANKASEGLWKLAELAELQGPVSSRNKSNKRTADDAAVQQRTKRSRC
ncbi:unnamed protein product [Rhizoctonia solani]|uniref:Myb-like domain-containing protein n=1 Tax=Rhizoctonia solani TaxID=456999 RepID=A0A8H3DG96_9AGAM|nr:unnamed protein product [Rhizoctonia solani]